MTVPTCNAILTHSHLMCVLPADHPGNGHSFVASSGMHLDAEPAGEDR